MFWELESVGNASPGEAPDNAFLGQYIHTCVTSQLDGTYSLCFPRKDNHSPLPYNWDR